MTELGTQTTQTFNQDALEEIVMRSVKKYLERPGHARLPGGIISVEEFDRERHNSLLRVKKLWEYWHGSPTLNQRIPRTVSGIPNT